MPRKKKVEEVQQNDAILWKVEADVDATVDELVQKGLKALDTLETFDQEKIDYIVAKMSVAGIDQHGMLAEFAVNETGRGVFEDKPLPDIQENTVIQIIE